MPALRAAYPHLLPRYQHFYRGAYAPKEYSRQVIAKVAELRDKWGLNRHEDAPRPAAGQMRLAL